MPLFLSILLTGCSQKTPEPEIKVIEKEVKVKLEIPQELLDCKDMEYDVTQIKKQSDIANLLIELEEDRVDCKSKLATIKTIYNKYRKEP